MATPRTPRLQGRLRRQAQPHTHRAAMLINIHAATASIFPPPPGPPTWINRAPGKASLEGSGGGAIAFNDASSRRHLKISVDQGLRHYVAARGTKQNARFASFEIPRKHRFHPRNHLNLPHAAFCTNTTIYLYLSLFLEEREEKRGAAGSETASTKKKNVNHLYPRICRGIHGFFVDEKAGKTQCWRGFRPVWRSIHGSTGGNALPPAAAPALEVFP